MTAAAATITAEELAVEVGVGTRTVRGWIRRGLPATKGGRPPRWRIERSDADPWIAANASAGIGQGITGLKIPAGRVPPAVGNGTKDDVEAGIERHIDRLDLILSAFTDLLFNAKEFDPRLVTSVKTVSTELRRLETHRLEMRKADEELMDRADHVRILGTFTRLVVDEIQAWARSTPDEVVDALTRVGVKTKAKLVIRELDQALEAKASELRTRITEAMTQAEGVE